MTAERELLWSVAEPYIGSYGGVTLSGTPTNVTLAAINAAEIIAKFDHKLDDHSWIMEFFKPDGPPSSVKPEWCFNHLDLGILDTKRKVFAKIKDGPH